MKQLIADKDMNKMVSYKRCKFQITEAYGSADGVYVKALETTKWIKAGDFQWIGKKALTKALKGA